MPLPDPISVTRDLVVPLSEIEFQFSRSSGKGGQNVNKTETRVEIFFDVAASPSLSDSQRSRLLRNLAPRLVGGGVLHLAVSEARTQMANREIAVERLVEILRKGLVTRKKRRPTRPTAASRERRIDSKKQRGAKKADRRGWRED